MRVVGTAASNAVLAVDQRLADNAKARVWGTVAVGAAGFILTLLVTIGLARSVNRRPTRLPFGNQDLHPERDRGFASEEGLSAGGGSEAVEEEGLQPPGCLVRASVVRQLLC